MKTIVRALKNAPKRSGVIAMALAAVVVPATLFAWGPASRPTFTYDKPADYVTFNSMTGTPHYGDERNFVRVKEATGANNTYKDNFELQPGKEYTAMVYYHNNAKSSLNQSGVGVAKDTTMRIQMPGVVKNGQDARITGLVTASNANPATVWDEAYGKASKGDVALRYVQNSATIYSNGAVDGKKLPNELFTTGTKLGYNQLDGVLPGCNEYAGYVTFNFKVDQPNFEIAKTVSMAGTNQYAETVAAKPGDEVEYKIQYKNTGTTQQDNVFIIDELPKGVEYVEGSTHVANQKTDGQWARINEDTVVNRGISVGSYAPGANAYVKFKAKVVANDKLEKCGVNTIVNKAIASTDNGTRNDTATVTVTKTCEEAPAKIEVCELATKKTIQIDAKQFDSTKHSKNLNDCKQTPVVKNITVCELATKKSVTIKETDFDASKHSKDMKACETPVTPEPETPVVPETPVEETPVEEVPAEETPAVETPVEELPQTGASNLMISATALATIIAALGYVINSRRSV